MRALAALCLLLSLKQIQTQPPEMTISQWQSLPTKLIHPTTNYYSFYDSLTHSFYLSGGLIYPSDSQSFQSTNDLQKYTFTLDPSNDDKLKINGSKIHHFGHELPDWHSTHSTLSSSDSSTGLYPLPNTFYIYSPQLFSSNVANNDHQFDTNDLYSLKCTLAKKNSCEFTNLSHKNKPYYFSPCITQVGNTMYLSGGVLNGILSDDIIVKTPSFFVCFSEQRTERTYAKQKKTCTRVRTVCRDSTSKRVI